MYETATHWLLKQRDGDMTADDWDTFTSWLEEDASHAQVFDTLAEADGALDAMLPELEAALSDQPEVLVAANDNPLARVVPWLVASAAAMVLAIFVWPQGPAGTTTIATAPGEVRSLALSDAITMTVNGGTRVEVTEGEPEVRLERGEVVFAVASEQPSPLRVAVDDLILTDIGTEFSVTLSEETVRVAVAEGIVAVNPEQENVEIPAGEAVEKRIGSATLERSEIDPAIVASWRDGRLEFDDTPINRALAQLERSTGVNVSVADRFAAARLTGSIAIDGEPEQIARRFADIVGGTAEAGGEGWIIK